MAESLDKPFPWAVGFFFGNTELSLELWNAIAGGRGRSSTIDGTAEAGKDNCHYPCQEKALQARTY